MRPDVVAAAQRAPRAGWRDVRVLAGVGLMALAVLVGSWVLATSDEAMPVLAARHELHAGDGIGPEDLVVRRVRLPDAETRASYLRSSADLPAGAVAVRDVGTGELLPRSALRGGGAADPRVEVPLSVAVDDVPVTVRAGSIVDVWVLPQQGPGRARRVLDGVTVLRLAGAGDSLAPRATRQVVIGMPGDGGPELEAALGRIAGGRVLLTRQG